MIVRRTIRGRFTHKSNLLLDKFAHLAIHIDHHADKNSLYLS